ncbi:MAG: alpha-ribazole phosphatase family protein [Pseudomonadota bacterium]
MGLILLRHTTPDVSLGTCYGRTDLDVVDSFADEARKAAEALPAFDRIVSSPLTRCRRLASFVAERAKLDVQVDMRIQEMDFGNWEGFLWSDIPREGLDAWAADFLHARPHGGESVAELRDRVGAALADWSTPGISTLIVTHSGVIRAALSTGDGAGDFNVNIDFGGFVTLPPSQGDAP